MEFIYLLTPCFVSFAADGVGPRNVVGSKLLKLLIFIFFCREQCWRSGIVVCVVIYLKFFITFAGDLHLKYGIRPMCC